VKAPWVTIWVANGANIGSAWTCRYLIISSERHLPRRRMTSVSTAAHSKDMAPEERKDLAEISSGAIPKVSPRAWAAPRKVLVRVGASMADQRTPSKYW
jgi:hypothetical protein